MNSFSAGFIAEAAVMGLTSKEATQLLKRAAEYPGMEQLTSHQHSADEAEDPSSMEALKELVQQDIINKNFGGYKHKINI
jgi:hypothetical protein